MKESLKPCACKLRDAVQGGPRTFCRTVRRAARAGEVKAFRAGAEGKPSPKRARVGASRPETG